MNKTKRWFLASLLSGLVLMSIGWGELGQAAEKYPTTAIDIIVPFGPGGGTDLPARVMAAYLKKKWGVPLNIVNRPGGKTIPATLEFYKATPDGYTMMADSRAGCSIPAATVKNLPFDPLGRTFCGILSLSPYIYIVPTTSPFKTLEDFVSEAKKNPENMSFTGGDPGIESVVKKLVRAIGVDISKMKLIQITGGAQSVVLTAGGHVTLGCSVVSSIMPGIKGGTVRGLAITSEKRYPDLPDLPTGVESGYPTLIVGQWVGISGQSKLPSYIADMWAKALKEMAEDPGVISKLRNVGALPFYHDPQATREYVTQEIEEAKK